MEVDVCVYGTGSGILRCLLQITMKQACIPLIWHGMFILWGHSKVLTKEQCKDKEFLRGVDFSAAVMHIKKGYKHKAFSLIPQRTKTGIEWRDCLPEEGLLQDFSRIPLEDLERFVGIDYDVL